MSHIGMNVTPPGQRRPTRTVDTRRYTTTRFLGWNARPNSTEVDPQKALAAKQRASFALGGQRPSGPLLPDSKPPERERTRRTDHVKELLSSEEAYVSHLSTFQAHYQLPMQDCGLLDESDVYTLFSITSQLVNLHENLLAQLRVRINSYDNLEDALVGDIFKEIIPSFKMYQQYVVNYDKGTALYDKLMRECEEFALIMPTLGEKPLIGQLGFDSLRIMPVQRIPRYVLLLQDLVKTSPPKHPDLPALNDALERCKETANYINEQKRMAEQRHRVAEITQYMKNRKALKDSVTNINHSWEKVRITSPVFCAFCELPITPGIRKNMHCTKCDRVCHKRCYVHIPLNCMDDVNAGPLLKAGRVFIRDGFIGHKKFQLNRGDHSGHQSEKHYVALFNDGILVATVDSKDHADEVVNFIRWYSRTTKREIAVTNVPNAAHFTITAPRESEVHTFSFVDEEEKKAWYDAVNAALCQWKETSTSAGGSSTTQGAAKGEKTRSDSCSNVQQVTFSIANAVQVMSKKGEFTAYVVDMKMADGTSKTLLKRYRAFNSLHCEIIDYSKQLRESFSPNELPRMPKKRLLRDNNDKFFTERRCRKLEAYMNGLTMLPHVWKTSVVQSFLCDSDETEKDKGKTNDIDISAPRPVPRAGSFVINDEDDHSSDEELEGEEELEASDSVSYVTAEMLWDLKDQREGTLNTLKKGDLITVVEWCGEEWVYACGPEGESGYVPRSYFKVLDAATP